MDIIKKDLELAIIFIKIEAGVHCICTRTSQIRRKEEMLTYAYVGENGERSFLHLLLQGSE